MQKSWVSSTVEHGITGYHYYGSTRVHSSENTISTVLNLVGTDTMFSTSTVQPYGTHYSDRLMLLQLAWRRQACGRYILTRYKIYKSIYELFARPWRACIQPCKPCTPHELMSVALLSISLCYSLYAASQHSRSCR